MAKQIAQNAANFGKSNLRFEDTMCYIATALDHLADTQKNTNINEPWNPVKIKRRNPWDKL